MGTADHPSTPGTVPAAPPGPQLAGTGPVSTGWRGLRAAGAAEWHRVVDVPWRRLRARRLAAVPLTLTVTVLVVVVHYVQQTASGGDVVRVLGGVRADLSWPVELLRTPLSLVVADAKLPVWGGLPRLLVGLALAELTLGWWRALLVGYLTSLAGTLAARVMIALGPDRPFGLAHSTAHEVDTGYSAAVVGLCVFVAVVRRSPVLFLATGGLILVQSVTRFNLAGREHVVAISTAVALGGLAVVRQRNQHNQHSQRNQRSRHRFGNRDKHQR